MDQHKICPKCKKKYTHPSAISRIDNKTEICPKCGTGEAIMNYIDNLHKNRATN